MEKQRKLIEFTGNLKLRQRTITKLQPNKLSLELEKEKFIINMSEIIDRLKFDIFDEQVNGRPRNDFRDIIKALLVMSYNNMSYRRTQSDLRKMCEEDLIKYAVPRSTLNDYVNREETKNIIERLIQLSALLFVDNEDTAIIDSTWFGLKMYLGGYKQVHDKREVNLNKCRKIHVVCLRNSKIIAYAKATAGNFHDSPFFEELLRGTIHNGFILTKLICDAGYSSKENYATCRELGVEDAYIDFRSNASLKRPKSNLWREKLRMYKENHNFWHEEYRFRVLIESVFSAIKRKNTTFLRSKNALAQDTELLLKVLVYNITIIGKFFK